MGELTNVYLISVFANSDLWNSLAVAIFCYAPSSSYEACACFRQPGAFPTFFHHRILLSPIDASAKPQDNMYKLDNRVSEIFWHAPAPD